MFSLQNVLYPLLNNKSKKIKKKNLDKKTRINYSIKKTWISKMSNWHT